MPTDGSASTDDTLKTVNLTPNGTPFQQGRLYEFAYAARDPLVAGVGFAAFA